jgi:hypothetical protein
MRTRTIVVAVAVLAAFSILAGVSPRAKHAISVEPYGNALRRDLGKGDRNVHVMASNGAHQHRPLPISLTKTVPTASAPHGHTD